MPASLAGPRGPFERGMRWAGLHPGGDIREHRACWFGGDEEVLRSLRSDLRQETGGKRESRQEDKRQEEESQEEIARAGWSRGFRREHSRLKALLRHCQSAIVNHAHSSNSGHPWY